MRRLLFLALCLITVTGLQTITNCSRPLDNVGDAVGHPLDTIYRIDTVIIGETDTIVDTLIIIDTVGGFDTIYQVDTIIIGETDTVVDTLLIVDTVGLGDTIVLIDTVFLQMNYCARLSSGQQEIIWMLQNSEGEYELELVAAITKDGPPQTLVVEIDGELIQWSPTENNELTISRTLDQGTVARVYSNTPHSFGHAIDICLKVNPL